jgi:hypothetical protein
VHCINTFFSPTRKEGIKNMVIKAQGPLHSTSNMEDILNKSQDGKGFEVIYDTQGFLNSDSGTDIEHNMNCADHDVAMNKCKVTSENDICITGEEINQESIVTTENSGGTKETDIDMMKTNSKGEETSQPCDTELSHDNMQTAVVKLDDEKTDDLSQKIVCMSVSIESIKKKIEEQKKYNTNRRKHQASVKFRAEIDPAKNQSAELELRKEISQDMFAKVSVCVFVHHHINTVYYYLERYSIVADQYMLLFKNNNSIRFLDELIVPQEIKKNPHLLWNPNIHYP